MADVTAEIMRVLEQCKSEIQSNMAAKNINASGRSSRAFHVRKTADAIQLVYGSAERIAPLDTLEIGRPAGNVPGGFSLHIAKTGAYAGRPDVSNKFKGMLMYWAEEKGISMTWGGATNLGRKIAYSGTDRHRNPEDVWSTPVNKAVETLRHDLRILIASSIHQTITTHF